MASLGGFRVIVLGQALNWFVEQYTDHLDFCTPYLKNKIKINVEEWRLRMA